MVKKKNKISQKESWYIFSICILGIFLLASLGLFLQNPFTSNLPTSTGLRALGEIININVSDNGSNSQSVYFYGSLLPGYEANQEVNVVLRANQQDAVVRGKVFMYDSFGKYIPLSAVVSNDWELKNDNYYYFNSTLTPNLSVRFLQAVQIPGQSAGLNSSNIYSIIFSIETLPATSDYQNIWSLN